MHKILKIVAAVLGLVGVIFLVRIIAAGDEAIKSGESGGLVDPMAYVAYFILGLVLAFVVFFVLKNLFTSTAGLKNTLIGVGAFVAILVISYALSDTENPIMQDGKNLYKYADGVATSNEVKLSGAGLVSFYILLALAAVAMIFSGVKKILSK